MLVIKNLSAHRQSNRLTTIIYSLTLGSIIFILVASTLNISHITSGNKHGNIDLEVFDFHKYDAHLNTTLMEPVLRQYKPYIKEFGYLT